MMPLAPEVVRLMEMMRAMGRGVGPMTLDAVRLTDRNPWPVAKAEVAEVQDIRLTADGRTIPARRYHPAPGETLPAMVFYHGGGWVCGNLGTHDGLCRALAARSGRAVIAIDYPRAPEAPFPEPLHACFAALQAVVAGGAGDGVDTSRIAVGGDSAGGNLAAAVAVMARDAGGPAITHQLLIYPVTDSDFGRECYDRLGTDYLLTTEAMRWFWEQYLQGPLDDPDPLAAVLRIDDLARLPPATVITAEYDPLVGEGEAYAARLRDAGVPVRLTRVPGVIHGFASLTGLLPQADIAIDLSADALRGM